MSIANQHHQRLRGRSRRAKLRYCRMILRKLNPERPPRTTTEREFRWQYRALRERIHVYSECLENVPDPVNAQEPSLVKAELAIDLSLNYFQDVLAPRTEDDDE